MESASLCQRVALNLSGAEKAELKRGDVLVDERLNLTTDRLDARLEIRPAAKRPLKNNQRVRFFLATAESIGRVIVLEEPGQIIPKERGLVQIVLEEPVIALAGDRFVIRDETNLRTLGGGIVLNPLGRRTRKPLETYLRHLNALSSPLGPDAVEALIGLQGSFAMTAGQIAQLLNAPIAEIELVLRDSRFIKLSLGDEGVSPPRENGRS